MHKKLYNQARIEFIVTPVTPLLIKAGGSGVDPSLPDMEFVRTTHLKLGETVFIPGSSLKGVFRSYSEKMLRTVGLDCCNPVNMSDAYNPKTPKGQSGSCNQRYDSRENKPETTAAIYQEFNCYACKLYGSTAFSSRIRFTDAHPIDPAQPDAIVDFKTLRETNKVHLEKRDGVAIDRLLGSVAQGPFDMEVLSAGTFRGEVFLKNFQWWQVALLGLTFRDIDLGYVQMGFSKSRGLGRVNIVPQKMEVMYFTSLANESKLPGLGVLEKNERNAYGLHEKDEINLPQSKAPVTDWLRTTYTFKQDKRDGEIDAIFKAAVEGPWADLVKTEVTA